ncbi:MAG: hypothetical protein H7Z21_09150 [Hymenobacter sp.]|nr:hypothetical protein [Hymenobacter sp.]
MRDKRFVALRRGGLLTKECHRALSRWARQCVERVLPLLDELPDERLTYALHVAEAWENDRAAVGDATKASVGAHAAAREATTPVSMAVARAVGQAVATAHMADHSLGGALYALKAMQQAGLPLAEERAWQLAHLPLLSPDLRELVETTLESKGRSFGLW